MKHQKQASLGLAGLALIASPMLMKLPAQFNAYNAATTIRASEDIERTKATERANTANLVNELGVLPAYRKLRMRGYLDSPKRNPRPDVTGYLEDETVYVYDSVGKCIGRIEARQWQWKYRFLNACNNSPPLTVKQE
ncbi:hypothetical protein H6G41_29825 [Tolypothrix sp. FACHB-123]|uniref:hypothetical protein n=1 Tax=Tolypothrix sp. FACHB-123 TaxID=2692868 RepID=UPI001686A037|nr:hypothetical protein [Tolypothrix sp. FACHB-123]MBD2358746.1 hypothetical protein [Tolypothrix sp. FACHB-123]